MLKHILVTLDGSELAETALEYARAMVAPGGRITLLSVLDIPDMQMLTLYEVPLMMQPNDYNEFVATTERSAREYLRRTADKLQLDASFTVDYEFDSGDPAAVILERAKVQQVDAIVMSTHGRSGFSRWLFGSVTQKVLNAMPCPVLVVPGAKKLTTQERAAVPAAEPVR
ncbi:MAG: universal stress protein [Anaerolineae bacterium]|jgi:nucleotide-binding universal stress UspA family protein|nr:universal stress protein [Anaerolineae bacterium]